MTVSLTNVSQRKPQIISPFSPVPNRPRRENEKIDRAGHTAVAINLPPDSNHDNATNTPFSGVSLQ